MLGVPAADGDEVAVALALGAGDALAFCVGVAVGFEVVAGLAVDCGDDDATGLLVDVATGVIVASGLAVVAIAVDVVTGVPDAVAPGVADTGGGAVPPPEHALSSNEATTAAPIVRRKERINGGNRSTSKEW